MSIINNTTQRVVQRAKQEEPFICINVGMAMDKGDLLFAQEYLTVETGH